MVDLATAAFNNIDHNLHTGFVIVDLKKAFVTVCHKILLNKLTHYGIREVAFMLLNSYVITVNDSSPLIKFNLI